MHHGLRAERQVEIAARQGVSWFCFLPLCREKATASGVSLEGEKIHFG